MRLGTLENRVFLALVLATSAFFLWMVRAFIQPIFWAVIFAVLFRPVYLRTLDTVRGRKNVAAGLTTMSVLLVVGLPTAFLVSALAQQAVSVYERILAEEIDIQAPIAFVERQLPAVAGLLERYGIEVSQARLWVQDAAVIGTQWIASQGLAAGQNALTILVLSVLMLYVLFFLFRDGDVMVQRLVRALPMGDEREIRLFTRFAQVSRATVKGTLVVAGVQGTLGGLLFAAVGLQAPVFWGVLMGVFSLLPGVGPALVWVPASIYLFASGRIVAALVLFAGGAVVVGLVDNLLRPILVGRQARLPDYLVLLATLGGLTVFGIAGFVAGPVIAALFLVMWEMFIEEYAPLDSSQPPAATGTVSSAVVDAASEPGGISPTDGSPATGFRSDAHEPTERVPEENGEERSAGGTEIDSLHSRS